nr:hypothetical protein GCM10020063_021330 [Dactylosporangium thailandense]
MLETAITVRENVDLAVIDIAAKGRWTWQLRVDFMAAVRKSLAQQPRALILDLAGLVDAERELVASVLLAEQQSTVHQPPVPLLVVAREAQALRLHYSGVARRIPVHADGAAALSHLVESTPPFGQARLLLQPSLRAAAKARGVVDDACRTWGLPQVLYPARLIVSELAANAIEHAGSPFTVTLTRRGAELLHIAVEDDLPRLPKLRLWPKHADPMPPLRGNGLRIVSAAASAWGSHLTAHGKVVWATLRAGPGRIRTAGAAPGAAAG